MAFEAIYYDGDGDASVESLDGCAESNLGGSASEEDVSCSQVFEGEHNCLLGACSYDPPEDTQIIGYEICVSDINGDTSCAITDEDGEVDVVWD